MTSIATFTEDTASRDAEPKTPSQNIRSGACRECLQKHLLKAEGYAEEMREDASRAWEKKQLLKNLLLAEDHALALGDEDARAAIRSARLAAEGGSYHAAHSLYDSLYDPSCGCRKKTEEHGKHEEEEAVSPSSPVGNDGGQF